MKPMVARLTVSANTLTSSSIHCGFLMKMARVTPHKGQAETSAQLNSEHLFILEETMLLNPHGKQSPCQVALNT